MSPPNKKPLLTNGVVLNGKWEILEHIADGGKGEVYRARQTNLDRVVVVKTISLEFLGEFADDEEQIDTEIERFRREATAMAQVRHPYVVQVYDQGSDILARDGSETAVQYLVMEYVPGATLRSTMPEDGFGSNEQGTAEWIRNYFLPILDGVESIHGLGIVHRDIKPENVLLDGSTPKITDFGIVGGVRWRGLTRSHHVEGTISYMAPEQFMDLGETDVRGDIYALGKMLYEASTGRMKDGKTAFPLKGVSLPDPKTPFLKRLDSVVREATAEDKERRTPSADALRRALMKLVEDFDESGDPRRSAPFKRFSRRRAAVGAGVVLSVFGLFLASHLFHHFYMSSNVPTTSAPSPSASQDPTLKSVADGVSPVVASNHTPVTLKGKDGCILRLVPEGDVALPEDFGSDSGRSKKVRPFYLYETPVTNRNYVDFLNRVLSGLRVEGGVVRSGERIWLMLGEVVKGYEPIVFQDGSFAVKDPAFAFRPVVRVTAYGALAYAGHYGERLPTVMEWLRVLKADRDAPRILPSKESKRIELGMDPALLMEAGSGTDTPRPPVSGGMVGARLASRLPTPGILFTPDEFGIRGLGKIIGEWGLRESDPSSGGAPTAKFVILGGLGSSVKGSKLTPVIERNPWEALEEVGFRCALSVKIGDGE